MEQTSECARAKNGAPCRPAAGNPAAARSPALAAALAAASLLLTGCGSGEDNSQPNASAADAEPAADPAATGSGAGGWDIVSSGEGVALVFPAAGAGETGEAAIRLYCPAREDRILVNVPAFRPIGSEERLSFGSGGAAHALVADTSGDPQRGGVSGTGAVPGNLPALIGGPVSVSYGAQVSGPHPAPPANLARAFAAACREGAPGTNPGHNSGASAGATGSPATSPGTGRVSACLIQDGERLSVTPLHAVGTEPFWAAHIEGRCVTYMHPENQDGTRVWTQYTANSGGGATWRGALENDPFILTTSPQPGCSDGMSSKDYPFAVELTVGGEERRGCAEVR